MKRFKGLGGLLLGVICGLGGCGEQGFVTPSSENLGTNLNTNMAEAYPRLSYEGKYLVFASDRRGTREIFLYDRTSNRLLPLPGLNQPGVFHDQPDISADGRYLVYLAVSQGKSDIWVYDRQSLAKQNITANLLGEVRHPSISGNGRFLTFESDRRGQWNIEIYDRGVATEPSLPSKREAAQ